jgi:hypothetical protein
MNEYGLQISYSMSENRFASFRLPLTKFDRSILIGRIRLVSSPRRDGEPYRYKVDPWLQEFVKFRFCAIRETDRWTREKGDISEEIQRYLLYMMSNWEEVADHPHATRGEGSKRNGPDDLQRFRPSSALYYYEFKWQEKADKAIREAHAQIQDYLLSYPMFNGEMVSGGYIGLLDWNLDEDMLLYVNGPL